MRHVSRTHRVALDWFFDRINLDSKIWIKYIDTKNQLADILTEEISHVMNGIMFCVCSKLAISVLSLVLKWCGKERISAVWAEKTIILGKSAYLFVILRNGRSCQEMRGTILWVGKQGRQNNSKISIPCIEDHHFKEEELKPVGELSKICSQIVLKCLYMARTRRPDILWSVNKLARSITKWTKACHIRLSRLISSMKQTSEYKQYCHVGNTAKQCKLGLFQDSDFCGRSWRFKITSGGTLCIFDVKHLFQSVGCVKFQFHTVQQNHKSISLYAGLRMDGIPALDLWDQIVAVFWKHDSEPW